MDRHHTKVGMVIVASVLATWCASAKTVLYVDDGNYNPDYVTYQDYKDHGYDGSTEEKAYGTIQMAVDAIGIGAKEDPNEIIVLPGVYDKGVSDALIGGGTQGRSRIFIDQKSWLWIHSKSGAASTHIVGARDPDSTDRGNGDKAVRGICNHWSQGLRVTGFTIRDCASMVGDRAEHNYSEGSAITTLASGAPTMVADCVISNCVARDGVVFGGMCFRTLICDNVATSTSIVRCTDLYSSIVTRNWCSSENVLCSMNRHYVNCTIINNNCNWAFYGGYAYNTIVSHCCGTDNELYGMNDASGNVSTAGGNVYQTIAPVLGDFRLISGCAAETAGDPARLSAEGFYKRDVDWFPTEWLNKDFNGNPIVAKDGKVMAGAIQETVVPAGGRIEFSSSQIGSRLLSVEGRGCWFSNVYAYPSSYPVQWRVSARLADGEELFGYSYADSSGRDGNKSGRYLFPHLDGTVVMTPPPDPLSWVRRTMETASRVVWADPTAVKAEQDGSFEHPYRELCDVGLAIQNESRVIVKLKRGTYEEGEYEHRGLYNRFTLLGGSTLCRFVGVDGAENTFVRGAADPDNPSSDAPGCGPKAMRIFTSQSAYSCQMQGITFAEGFTRASSSAVDSGHGGLCYVDGTVVFADCVITNCGGVFDLASYSSFVRSKIVDCHPMHRIVYGSSSQSYPAISCYFENVSTAASYFDIFTQMPLFECTVVDTLGWGAQCGYASEATLFGCVLSGGGALKCGSAIGNVLWNYSGTARADGCTSVDPLLIEAGSPTLFAKSAAITAGAAPTVENAGADHFMYDGADIDGNKLLITDGRFAPGARHTFRTEGVYVTAQKGGVAVTDGTVGYNRVETGSLALSIAAADRPCIGVAVNGVTNLYDAVPSRVITSSEAASGVLIEALYSNEWRVRPDGNDSDLGFTAGTAFKTLQQAMKNAISGNVVRAGPGVYSEGGEDTTDSQSPVVRSRVVVKSGVLLVSDCGPDETVIEGESDAETPDSLGGVPEDPTRWGCGPKAMRCVYLKDGATVRGFTLRGGRTRGVTGEEGIDYRFDYSGGAVLGSSRSTSIAENCVITNCGAYRGGAVRKATVKKCRISDCFALKAVAGVAEGFIYGCLIERVRGNGPANWDLNYLADSTIRDVRSLDGSAVQIPWTFDSELGLGAFACNVAVDGYHYYQGAERNVYATNIANPEALPAVHPEIVLVSAAEMALDVEGRPVAGQSVLTEKADASLDVADFDYETDLSGSQRVMNGMRDVGALEADWRGVYAKDIGNRSVTVTAATPAVFEDAGEKSVLVPAGGRLEVRLQAGMKADYLFRFRVPEGGSLVLAVDGSETAYSAGLHEVALSAKELDRSLVFASTVGTAELLKGRSLAGLLLTIW